MSVRGFMPRLLTCIVASLVASCLVGDANFANAMGEFPRSRAETLCCRALFDQEALEPVVRRYPSAINRKSGIGEANLEKEVSAFAVSSGWHWLWRTAFSVIGLGVHQTAESASNPRPSSQALHSSSVPYDADSLLSQLPRDTVGTKEMEALLSQAREALQRMQAIPTHIANRLAQATIVVVEDWPTFGEVLHANPVDPELPVIVLNAGFVATLSPGQKAFLVGHELGHIWQGNAEFTRRMISPEENLILTREIEVRADAIGVWVAKRLVGKEASADIVEFLDKAEQFRRLLPLANLGVTIDPLFDPHLPIEVRTQLMSAAHSNDSSLAPHSLSDDSYPIAVLSAAYVQDVSQESRFPAYQSLAVNESSHDHASHPPALPERDISISAEGEGAATHEATNDQLDQYWTAHREQKFRIEEIAFRSKLQAIWRIAQAGEWRLALNALRYSVFLYGEDGQMYLLEGVDEEGRSFKQTTHAGISTGAIHLARGEYLRLVQAERDKPGHYYLAGRIAHETKEIISWRRQARSQGLRWRKVRQDISPMRQWIQNQLHRLRARQPVDPHDNPDELDKRIHGEGLNLERAIAQDRSIGQKEVPLGALFENQIMVKTILQAVVGDAAQQITLTDILTWVGRLTFAEQINLPASAALPSSSQQIYIVVVGEQRYAVLMNREETPFGISVSGAIAPTKRGHIPSVYYQIPSSMAHAIQQRIDSIGRFPQSRMGLTLWRGWIRSDYDRLLFQQSLDLHPTIKRFILYWLQNGMRPVVEGVWELFNPNDPNRQLKDEAGAYYVGSSNTIIRNTALNSANVSPFVHEYIHTIVAQMDLPKQQSIETYFRQYHPEFAHLFKDNPVYQGAETTYATEAAAYYLQMALTGFRGLYLSENARLVLTDRDVEFFEQLGLIDTPLKELILHQLRNQWMGSFNQFWTMPEESRAILFSTGANAKRVAARQALIDEDPFDLAAYALKPAPIRNDINISSEGPSASRVAILQNTVHEGSLSLLHSRWLEKAMRNLQGVFWSFSHFTLQHYLNQQPKVLIDTEEPLLGTAA
jgi:hypothetical protein